VVIQERESDLLLGTHGRSIYKANVGLLQQMTSNTMGELQLAAVDPIRASQRWGSERSYDASEAYFEPSEMVQVYAPASGKMTLSVKTKEESKTLKSWTIEVDKGVNEIEYKMDISEKGMSALKKMDSSVSKADNGTYYLPKGMYVLSIEMNGKIANTDLEVK